MNQRFKQLQRLRPSRRAGAAMIAFAVSMLVGWYAGVDLLQRGPSQAFVLIEASLVTTLVWMCPIWPKEQRNGQ